MHIAVIGGGAAGFFTALNIAEKNPGHRIIIYEAGPKPLQKVFISGGGRCNLTQSCFDVKQLLENYSRGKKALNSVFARFQPRDTMTWFESRGLKLKTEEDGRVFPVSDSSEDVIDLFRREAKRLGVELRTSQRIKSIEKNDTGFLVKTENDERRFEKLILATGYSPPGWEMAKKLGHTIIAPVPSLFPFKILHPAITELQGMTLENVRGKLKVKTPDGKREEFSAEGPMLITHTGLSGPLIYRLSSKGARALAQTQYQADICLDFFENRSQDQLRAVIEKNLLGDWQRKKLFNTQLKPLPNRLWLRLLELADAPLETQGANLSVKTKNKLLESLKNLTLPVTGKSPSKEEFVSCGGVKLDEVNFQTMESKVCPGLYLAGEILDIDALTGGYNFQACWSEAWVISESIFG